MPPKRTGSTAPATPAGGRTTRQSSRAGDVLISMTDNPDRILRTPGTSTRGQAQRPHTTRRQASVLTNVAEDGVEIKSEETDDEEIVASPPQQSRHPVIMPNPPRRPQHGLTVPDPPRPRSISPLTQDQINEANAPQLAFPQDTDSDLSNGYGDHNVTRDGRSSSESHLPDLEQLSPRPRHTAHRSINRGSSLPVPSIEEDSQGPGSRSHNPIFVDSGSDLDTTRTSRSVSWRPGSHPWQPSRSPSMPLTKSPSTGYRPRTPLSPRQSSSAAGSRSGSYHTASTSLSNASDDSDDPDDANTATTAGQTPRLPWWLDLWYEFKLETTYGCRKYGDFWTVISFMLAFGLLLAALCSAGPICAHNSMLWLFYIHLVARFWDTVCLLVMYTFLIRSSIEVVFGTWHAATSKQDKALTRRVIQPILMAIFVLDLTPNLISDLFVSSIKAKTLLGAILLHAIKWLLLAIQTVGEQRQWSTVVQLRSLPIFGPGDKHLWVLLLLAFSMCQILKHMNMIFGFSLWLIKASTAAAGFIEQDRRKFGDFMSQSSKTSTTERAAYVITEYLSVTGLSPFQTDI